MWLQNYLQVSLSQDIDNLLIESVSMIALVGNGVEDDSEISSNT